MCICGVARAIPRVRTVPQKSRTARRPTKFGFPFPRSFLLPSFRSARFALIINERGPTACWRRIGLTFLRPPILRTTPLFWSNTVSALRDHNLHGNVANMPPNWIQISYTNPYAGIELEQVFKTPRGERRHCSTTQILPLWRSVLLTFPRTDDRGIKIQTRFCPSAIKGHE